jgi:hypothetical protein
MLFLVAYYQESIGNSPECGCIIVSIRRTYYYLKVQAECTNIQQAKTH